MNDPRVAVTYSEQGPDGWYFKTLIGPFETKEESDKMAALLTYEILEKTGGTIEVSSQPHPVIDYLTEAITKNLEDEATKGKVL